MKARAALRRIGAVAGLTAREAARQRLAAAMTVVALGLLGGARWLAEFNFGATELRFVADLGLGAQSLLGAVLAIGLGVQLVVGDLEQRTAWPILAKPVGRGEYLAGRYLGIALVLALFSAVVLVVLTGVLHWREAALRAARPDLGPAIAAAYADVLRAGAANAVRLGLLAAVTCFVASWARSGLLAATVAGAAWLALHVWPVAVEITLARGGGGWAVEATRLLPNLQLFNLADLVAAGRPVPGSLCLRVAAYGAGWTALFLAAGAAVLRRREIG